MRNRARLIAGSLIAVSFAVGALSGMAVEESLGLDWFDFLDEDEVEDSILAGFDLTDAQRRQAEAALERQEDRLEEYWEARLPEIRLILRESHAEIRQILTPEQQDAFDRRVRELGDEFPEENGD
jgi:Spy/CpxP family protein refolding chaperone